MTWLSFIPGKSTLVLLFQAAKLRVTEQTDDITRLPNTRIVSATDELNQIADDVRDSQAKPDASPLNDSHTLNPRHCAKVQEKYWTGTDRRLGPEDSADNSARDPPDQLFGRPSVSVNENELRPEDIVDIRPP
jgi:hypothetical protein